MRNERRTRGEMPAASQLLIGKSKPKVKIRRGPGGKREVTTIRLERNQSTIVMITTLAITLIPLMCLVAPTSIECRSRSPLRLARHATDESVNASSDSSELSSAFQSQKLKSTSTTSELSFEFLNLKSVPSSQLCQIEGRDRVNSVSFADNQIKSLQSRAFTCISFRLKILNLRNNRIESIQDDAFTGLNSLQVLILEGNKLAQVPTSPVSGLYLPALRHLNLAGNQITSVGPTSFEPGAQLISLSLRANPLTAIHSQAFAKLSSLKTLTLSHLDYQANHLGRFSGGLSELRFLHLDRFGANLSSLEEPFCESSRKLAGLSLKGNQLKRVPRFTNCQNLISLDLSYNSIQGALDGANFSHHPNLIDLYLGHNQLEYLGERALTGLDRLQVLELAANKLKSIHPSAFVPVRASLHELNIANNEQLTALPPNGLEGLISLRAYGNIRLRTLPAHLPAAKSLALTYAYHCCDYYTTPTRPTIIRAEEEASAGPSLPVIGQSYTGVRYTGDNDHALHAPSQRNINQDNNGNESLMSQLAHSISSKLTRFFWSPSSRQQHEDEYQSDLLDAEIAARVRSRASRLDDDANSRNLSESVLWPTNAGHTSDAHSERSAVAATGDNQELESEQQQRRARRQDSGKSSAHVHERQVVTRPEVVRARRDEVHGARQPNGAMIDELVVWQMRRIRFAHSLDEWPHDRADADVWPLSESSDTRSERGATNSMVARRLARDLLEQTWPARTRRAPSHTNEVQEMGKNAREMYANDREQVQCLPAPNAFQPCRDLFDSIWLRACVWLVFLLAFLGNICVIVVLGSVRPSSSTSALTSIMWFNAAHSKRHIDVPRFLVLNLALADLLMACYLGILALVDLSTLGEFRQYAIKWQHSTGCKLAGFLAVLSSELSVFILAIITLERNYAITNAVHLNRRLSLQKAIVIMFFGYVYALTMALMPLNGINDYRKFSICLPLEYQAHKPLLGSSSNLYLVMLISINTLSFVLLLSCYLRMYCAIRGSQAWNTNDLKIAKRMSVLVVTDFLCWSPIICVAIAALFGRHLVGPDGLKLLVIFVLPLNSVANPFLYAITTKKFKRDLAILKKRLRLEQAARHLHVAGAYLACSWARKSHQGSPPGGGGGGMPVASTMEQIYYRKSKHKLDGGGKLMMGSAHQALGRRAKSKLSKQELALATSHNNRAAGSSRAGGSRLVRLNQHHFQSFERNEEFAALAGGQLIARTHCPSCQRKLEAAAAATASALEPTTLVGQDPPETFAAPACQQELSYLLERTSFMRPRIVLDAVEPVVGVAMAPLRLVEDLGDGGQQLSAAMRDSSRTNSQSRAPSSVELLLVGDQDLDGQQQQRQQPRASSADNAAKPGQNQAVNLTRLSCQTVMVSDKITRSVLLAPQMSSDAFTTAANTNGNRSVSACAFMWPQSAANRPTHSNLENRPETSTTATRATCYSCSCDISQVGVAASGRKPLVRRTSAGVGHVPPNSKRPEGDRKHNQVADRSQRAKSINRLVLAPIAKAWSNLQLSLQSGLGGSTSLNAHTHHHKQQKSPSSHIGIGSSKSNQRQLSPVANGQVSSKSQGGGGSRRLSNCSATSSTEQDQLLLDAHEESVIIEDILQMSSPARRRLLRGGRRMSRSCDVILEQSYAGSSATTSGIHRASMTSGTTEQAATSSSYYDQNDDQRILLATINQLSARRKKEARRRARAGHQPHGFNRRKNQQPASDQRKVSFTRCRSWSPALLDKLEDCMYQIKSRIPGFHAREPWREEQTISSSTSSEAVGARESATRLGGPGALNACDDELNDEEGTTSESTSTTSRSSSGAIIEDDEFNEIGLDEWTRNMHKKAPVNCYTKSASRHRLKQQLSGNSDTLSGRTIGTTITSISFDSSSNIPAIISSHSGGHTADLERQSDDDDDHVARDSPGHESHNSNVI